MDARYEALYAAVVGQAFSDAAHDYHGKGMDARQWLELAGLLERDGTSRYGTPRRQRNGTATPDDYNARRRVARAAKRQPELQEA